MKVQTQTTETITLSQEDIINAILAYVETQGVDVNDKEIIKDSLPEALSVTLISSEIEVINTEHDTDKREELPKAVSVDMVASSVWGTSKQRQELRETYKELSVNDTASLKAKFKTDVELTKSIFADDPEPNRGEADRAVTPNIFA